MVEENYLDCLAQDILKVDNRVLNRDIGYACASSLIGAILPNVFIVTSIGNPASLAEMNMVVGDSGVAKTVLLHITRQIAIGLGIRLPSRYTTEGIEEYFSQKDENDKYINSNNGLIISDEIGQMFGDSVHKSHYAGTIEQLSRLYDHQLPETALVRGVRSPQDPYVSVIGATIIQFLPYINDLFFQQGLAGRFKWIYCDMDTEKKTDISAKEDRLATLANVISENIDLLYKMKVKYEKKKANLLIDPESNDLWYQFQQKCFHAWEYGRANCRFGWDWQYKIRLAELAIKQAGKWCVGRNFHRILDNGFDGVMISKYDMQRGIETIERSDMYLQTIIELRKEGLDHDRSNGRIIRKRHSINDLIYALDGATNKMLNNKQMQELSGVKGNTKYTELKKQCIESGWIGLVDKSGITDRNERKRLGIDLMGNRCEVYKLLKNPP